MAKNRASQIAWGVLVVSSALLFGWWVQNRPSVLLFQAHKNLEKDNQAAAIYSYQQLLKKPGLKPEEEIKIRKTLVDFYLRAVQESHSISMWGEEGYQVDHPFLEKASQECDRWTELAPADFRPAYQKGRIYLFKGLEKFALESFEKARANDPKQPEPYRYLSQVYAGQERYKEAQEAALQALAIRPDYDEARYQLIRAYQLLGNLPSALAEYDKLSSSFRSVPEVQAQYWLDLARQNYWEKINKEVVKSDVPAEESPLLIDGRLKLAQGRILLAQERFDEAAAFFSQAQALMPKQAWPLLWEVVAQVGRGNCSEAGRGAQFLSEALPRWPWTHYAKAHFFLCSGKIHSALSALQEAERLGGNEREIYELRIRACLDAQLWKETGGIVRPLLRQSAHQDLAYLALAQSFIQQGAYALAIESAESVIRQNPREAWAYVWLGWGRWGQKDPVGAERAFDSACEISSINRSIFSHRLLFYAKTGNANNARTIVDRYIQEQPRNAMVWLIKAKIESIVGNNGEALRAYQRAVELKPYLLAAQLGIIETASKTANLSLIKPALSEASDINSAHPDVIKWRSHFKQ